MKELYTFTIKDGKTEKKVFLKKLTYEDREEMGLVYSAALGKALNMGVMSRLDMRRVMAGEPIDRAKLTKDLTELENKYHELNVNKKDLKKVTKQIISLRNQISDYDQRLLQIFGHSAEMIADQRSVTWVVANFTFWDDTKTPVFGEDQDERVSNYYTALDEGTIEKTVGEKAFLFFHGFLMGQLSTEEDFQKLEENMNEYLSVEETIS